MINGFCDVKGKKIILCATSCFLFIAQIVICILFFSGTVNYYSEKISIIGAVDLILSIVNIAFGSIFDYLLKLMLGIVFIVVTIIIIKNLVASISCIINGVFHKGTNWIKIRESSFFVILGQVGDTLKYCFLFILLCSMTSVDYKVNNGGIAVLIVGAIAYFVTCCIMLYLGNYKLECLIYKFIATIIMVAAYIILLTKIQVASFEQLVYGLKTLFGGYLVKITTTIVINIIIPLVMPVLYVALQFYAFQYLDDIWGFNYYRKSDAGSYTTSKIMGMTISITVVNLAISIFLKNVNIINFSYIYKTIRNELPMLIASIILFVSFKFEEFELINKTSVVNDPPKIEKPQEKTENVFKVDSITGPKEKTQEIKQETPDSTATYEKHTSLETDIIERLKQYKELLDNGIITQEEFDVKKKQLLGL